MTTHPPRSPAPSFPERSVTAISRSVRALARRIMVGLEGAHDLPLGADEQPRGMSNPPSPYGVPTEGMRTKEDIEDLLDRARLGLEQIDRESTTGVFLRGRIATLEWVLGRRSKL